MMRTEGTIRQYYEALPSFEQTFAGRRGVGLLPGGYGRSTFALAGRVPMVRFGHGYWIVDDRGRSLIDLNNNFTALIHGSAHPVVTEATQRAVAGGASFGLPTHHELDLAAALLERLDYLDQVRFCSSGSEAVMLAVRLARAIRRVDKVVFVRGAYHGTADVALVPGGVRSRRGLPAGVVDDVVEVALNDIDGLRGAFSQNSGQIAAVVVDPMPNRAGLVAASGAFLREVRALCDTQGALLLADEVIALRQSYRGAVHAAGVVPDLVIAGKIIGGGLPVGAVLGPRDLMGRLDPRSRDGLEHGGTFSGNPVTMASGFAAMTLFGEGEVDRLNALGALARAEIAPGIAAHGWELRGAGSLFRAFPLDVGADEAHRMQTSLWWAAYERDLLLTQSTLCALSTPMDEGVVADLAQRFVDAVAATDTQHR